MITKKIPLFKNLEIETSSMCNRSCVTCLRNSDPDRESVASWFSQNLLPIETIDSILEQSITLGHRGTVCLSHYNEPLMDPRIAEIVELTKKKGFSHVFFGSNADFLTEDLAQQLDGVVDYIGFSFYMDDPKRSKRKEWVKSLFKKTKVTMGDGEHMVTHYSPIADVVQISKKHSARPCNRPQKRMIVNHKGEMLMCCDDLTGHFELGNVHDSTLEELWYSERHQDFVLALSKSGGRCVHSHCLSCPRD